MLFFCIFRVFNKDYYLEGQINEIWRQYQSIVDSCWKLVDENFITISQLEKDIIFKILFKSKGE